MGGWHLSDGGWPFAPQVPLLRPLKRGLWAESCSTAFVGSAPLLPQPALLSVAGDPGRSSLSPSGIRERSGTKREHLWLPTGGEGGSPLYPHLQPPSPPPNLHLPRAAQLLLPLRLHEGPQDTLCGQHQAGSPGSPGPGALLRGVLGFALFVSALMLQVPIHDPRSGPRIPLSSLPLSLQACPPPSLPVAISQDTPNFAMGPPYRGCP